MARIVVIGGIESTFRNAQVLHDLGEDIAMFYTRGPHSPGWEGVAMIDRSLYSFAAKVPITEVNGSINDHAAQIQMLAPDFIYSLGWQQIYRKNLREICPIIGIHESLLPKGAGAVPLANAILHGFDKTGCTLFWVDGGTDSGPIIGQLKMVRSPRSATATQLYDEAMELGAKLLRMYVPHVNSGTAPAIPQDRSSRTEYGKVIWSDWDKEKVSRARTYPYA